MIDYWAKTWFIMKITKSRTVLLKLKMLIYIYCLHSDSNLYQVNLIYLEKDEKEGFVKVCAALLDKLDDDAPSEV